MTPLCPPCIIAQHPSSFAHRLPSGEPAHLRGCWHSCVDVLSWEEVLPRPHERQHQPHSGSDLNVAVLHLPFASWLNSTPLWHQSPLLVGSKFGGSLCLCLLFSSLRLL